MKNRRTTLTGASMLLMISVAASACSSATTGSQSTVSANSTVGASPGATDSGNDASGSAITLPPGGAGGAGSTDGSGSGSGSGSGGGSSKTTSATTKHTSAPKTTTPTVESTNQPALVSFTYGTPSCKSMSGTGTVKLSWTTKYTDSVWLGESQVAFYFDPKGADGAFGPLSTSGSKTMAFDCTYQYEYYMIGVYNSVGKQGQTDQVPNPAYTSN